MATRTRSLNDDEANRFRGALEPARLHSSVGGCRPEVSQKLPSTKQRTADERRTDGGVRRLNTGTQPAADGRRTGTYYAAAAMKADEANDHANESLLRAIAVHHRALVSLRYGSFRGIVRDGKLVRFAIEHEWRPADNGGKEVD